MIEVKEVVEKDLAGTVTIGIDYYTQLIQRAERYETKQKVLKMIVDESSYDLKSRICELFNWTNNEE